MGFFEFPRTFSVSIAPSDVGAKSDPFSLSVYDALGNAKFAPHQFANRAPNETPVAYSIDPFADSCSHRGTDFEPNAETEHNAVGRPDEEAEPLSVSHPNVHAIATAYWFADLTAYACSDQAAQLGTNGISDA